jgi:hypothetical protein
MVFRNLPLLYLKLITYGDLFHALAHKIPEIFSYCTFAVFGSPHYVIPRVVYGMGCSSYSHAQRLSHFAAN